MPSHKQCKPKIVEQHVLNWGWADRRIIKKHKKNSESDGYVH